MKVDRYTRAGQYGRMISCPHCKNKTTVFHFAWSGLKCQKCKKMVDKNEWNVV
jgi:ribosomal protein S27E